MWRVRDEEIPRIALLTSAFFVASLIHVRLGPTSVHLLLNGLVGVILGWRAGLAIPVGLALQAVLLGHGGFSTIGVNASVMTIPALLCGGLFSLLRRAPWLRQRWFRTGLVAVVLMSWTALAIFVLRLLLTNPREQWSNPDPTLALRSIIYPPILLGIVGLGLMGAWMERRCVTTPNAILGFFIGLTSVMLTLVFNAFALVVGGAESWGSIVLLVFLAHLPIVVLEGIIMGFTVSFLNRVKPDLLVGWQPPPEKVPPLADSAAPARPLHAGGQAITGPSPVQDRSWQGSSLRFPTLLWALTGMLLMATPVWAHRLEMEYKILKDGRIQIESWFETGDSPPNAKVQVFLPGNQLLIDGKLDKDGTFVFKADRTLPLRVVINAGAGHRKELSIPIVLKGGKESNSENASSDGIAKSGRTQEYPYKDVLVGIGFLLATAAFALSLRNAQVLREIQESLRSAARRDS